MLPTPPPSPTHNSSRKADDRIGLVLAGRIQLIDVLGIGAYGCVVYKAVDLSTGLPYAVKALNKLGLDARQKAFHEREIRLHEQASHHPNVVSMLLKVDFPDCLFVVLEYCAGEDMFVNITDRGHYAGNDALAKCAFLQLIDAVQYCHSLGIYHRDLKPENVLLLEDGMTVKLADFGLATTDYMSTDFGCGSTFYMSPECQDPAPKPFASYASAANDVWSLGVVLVNLTCGRNPWKRASMDDSTFSAFVRDPSFLNTILPLSNDLDYILRRMFELDPTQRITLPELRELIIRCPAFTEQQALPPSPPYQPTDYPSDDVDIFQLAPEAQTPTYAPQPHRQLHRLQTTFSQSSYNTAYSHNSPAFSPSPSPQPPSPAPPQNYSTQQSTGQFSNTWYSSFMPALDLAQKHVSIQPLFSNVRML